MTGIVNLLTVLEGGWANIVVIIGVILVSLKAGLNYFKLSKKERVEIALTAIKQELLKYMSDAEVNWEEYKKSGSLKKSEVFTKIYTQFPELATYADQDMVVKMIEAAIDEKMKELDQIINNIDPENVKVEG